MAAALLAGLLAGLSRALGWRGVDLAATVYRVESFRARGFAIWDPQWYGGHWTLDYSVAFPALASWLGVGPLAVVSAALAALAFDRLVRERFPGGGRAASFVFAAGTLVQVAIGQLPFLCGEGLGLAACWAASRGRWRVAALLALGTTLSSPLAGAFVALAAAAWFAAGRRDARSALRAAALACPAMIPIGAMAALFPGQGAMPYPTVDYLWELAVAAGIWVAAGGGEPAIRWGATAFAGVSTIAWAVPSPLGGNVGRIEDVLALPLATALLWDRWRLLVPFAALPLALSQWVPALNAVAGGPAQPSTTKAFFAPLDLELARLSHSAATGRVEVVPTQYHWESAYVAPTIALARGWERQLDVADNPLFYRPDALTSASYRAWLLENGVTYVALARAPLDSAAEAEAKLVTSGSVAGLDLVWSSSDWSVYSVAGSPGVVEGPARLVSDTGERIVLDASRAGTVVVRFRSNRDWTLSGAGCLAGSGGPWIAIDVPGPEVVVLKLSLIGGDHDGCSSGGSTEAER